MEKGNKLIAEFMGIEFSDLAKKKGFYARNNYRYSWDMLMPVIEKIESLEFNVKLDTNYIAIGGYHTIVQLFGQNRIELTHKAVIEFIKWYNKNGG